VCSIASSRRVSRVVLWFRRWLQFDHFRSESGRCWLDWLEEFYHILVDGFLGVRNSSMNSEVGTASPRDGGSVGTDESFEREAVGQLS